MNPPCPNVNFFFLQIVLQLQHSKTQNNEKTLNKKSS
jgi:hypothetical protein